MQDYDVFIVGAGLNGASLAYALALKAKGLRIGLIEARAPSEAPGEAAYDARSIVLAYGSQLIYQSLGLWEALQAHTTAIHQVHVSERGRFGSLCFNAADLGVPALGYVLPAMVLQQVLNQGLQALSKQGAVDFIYPAQVTAIRRDAGAMTVDYQRNGQSAQLRTQLLVAADGADSAVRRLAHIPAAIADYGQTAIVAAIDLARSHHGIAYERFTAEGILAMLPLAESSLVKDRCTLVWTAEQTQAEQLLQLTDQAFLAQVQRLFGYRLGRLQTLGKRHALPLRRVSSLDSIQTRLVLMGNAVYSLHPVAAQGLNLGLRDAAILLETILEARTAGNDIGSLEVLRCYAERRGGDQQQIMGFVEGLVQIFAQQSTTLSRLRGLSLQLLDMSPAGKYYLARLNMGMAGRLSKLACGIPL